MMNEGPVVEDITAKTVTARKHHDCIYFCRKGIQPGEKYSRIVQKVDGEIWVGRAHLGGGYCAERELE